jgi:division protein CdvB (Snf7/Vps24/ESCRT-III family)
MMPDNFANTWVNNKKVPLSQRIVETIRQEPLKDRVTQTIYRLNMVQRKLEDSRLRIEQKYKKLFSKVIHAQEAKDTQTAVMYANECSQVKKMAQTITSSQLALEQVVVRLETVQDFGDVAAEIMPAASVVRSVKGKLAGVIPEVSMHLGAIGQTLDSLVLEVGQATGSSWNTMITGEDADRILAEATMIAEQKVKDGFPELPTPSSAEKGITPP